MLNYTLPIPHNEKINKTNSNVVGVFDYKSIALPTELQGHLEKAYIYSRIESQDSFRPFFYAQIIVGIAWDYTKTIPSALILFLYLVNKLSKIGQNKQLIMLVMVLVV